MDHASTLRTKKCRTALQIAASNNQVAVLKTLLRSQADVNLSDDDGSIALLKAAYGENADMATY